MEKESKSMWSHWLAVIVFLVACLGSGNAFSNEKNVDHWDTARCGEYIDWESATAYDPVSFLRGYGSVEDAIDQSYYPLDLVYGITHEAPAVYLQNPLTSQTLDPVGIVVPIWMKLNPDVWSPWQDTRLNNTRFRFRQAGGKFHRLYDPDNPNDTSISPIGSSGSPTATGSSLDNYQCITEIGPVVNDYILVYLKVYVYRPSGLSNALIVRDDLPFASCQDTNPVGDGWGWNGSSSCRVDVPLTCEDTDPVGDGWGWNGSSSCRI